MASATYDTIVQEVQQLTPEEQARLRDDIDTMLANRTSTLRRVRPGLAADLKEIEQLANEVGEAWQGHHSAAEAVSEMRR